MMFLRTLISLQLHLGGSLIPRFWCLQVEGQIRKTSLCWISEFMFIAETIRAMTHFLSFLACCSAPSGASPG